MHTPPLHVHSKQRLMMVSLTPTIRQCNALQRRRPNGTRLLWMRFRASLRIEPLSWYSFHLATKQLVAAGCSKSKRMLMDRLRGIRLVLLPKALHNVLALITQRRFAPTPKWPALRAILALAALEDLHLESVDISSAFLNGELEEEVYMHQPEGFVEKGNNWVWCLLRSIYGLKQAGRCWHKKLNEERR